MFPLLLPNRPEGATPADTISSPLISVAAVAPVDSCLHITVKVWCRVRYALILISLSSCLPICKNTSSSPLIFLTYPIPVGKQSYPRTLSKYVHQYGQVGTMGIGRRWVSYTTTVAAAKLAGRSYRRPRINNSCEYR